MARVEFGTSNSSKLSSPDMSVKLWLLEAIDAGSIGDTRDVTE